jgi:hypothetical protein
MLRLVSMTSVLLVLLLVGAVNAIYPDDHWKYSTEIKDSDTFNAVVEESIAEDQTLFVRWIASPNWGWWQKQSPSWNQVTKAFAGNTNVRFADINLKETPIRGEPYNPGAGGWPTIRYFNAETGKSGKPYTQKTKKAMCQELGEMDYMIAYVEEAGSTLLDSNMQAIEL